VKLQKLKTRKQDYEKRHHTTTPVPLMGKRQWVLSGAHPFIYFGYNALSFSEDFVPFLGCLRSLMKEDLQAYKFQKLLWMKEGCSQGSRMVQIFKIWAELPPICSSNLQKQQLNLGKDAQKAT
jgi:hypothetical protein